MQIEIQKPAGEVYRANRRKVGVLVLDMQQFDVPKDASRSIRKMLWEDLTPYNRAAKNIVKVVKKAKKT